MVVSFCWAARRHRVRPYRPFDRCRQRVGDRHLHAQPCGCGGYRLQGARRGKINIRAITTSEIKFSLLIDAEYTELAVRTLHSLYNLDKG